MRVTAGLRSICGVVLTLVAVLAGGPASVARAGERKPFEITHFTLEPTEKTLEESVERTIEKNVVRKGTVFVNQPYARPFTQAGAHPWGLTAKIEFSSERVQGPTAEAEIPTADIKDVVTDTPPGLLGNPMAVPRCPLTQVTIGYQCPGDTQVGVYRFRWFGGHEVVAPIVDVTPEAGQSAEFALENLVKGIATPLLTGHLVRLKKQEGSEEASYGLTVVSNNIPPVELVVAELTFWGVPGDPSHMPLRGVFCKNTSVDEPLQCQGGGESFEYTPLVPFLTMPADCSAGPQAATVRADTWQEPGSVSNGEYTPQWKTASAPLPAATGCDLLSFKPQIAVEPETSLADEAAGTWVSLKVPLNEDPSAVATPQLRDTVLSLPEGMSVNPSVVDGIQACEATGPEGIDIEGPLSEQVGLNGELQLAPGHCPSASEVGTAEAITPLLPIPVKGHLYLARPGCGGPGQSPCTEQDALDGNLYRLYLELGGEGELAQTGVHFKVPLQTSANLATGQLTSWTLGTPQTPFSEVRIHLNGGARAPLASPAACGPATTTADLTPWSAPGTVGGVYVPGTPNATPSSYFYVEGCSDPPSLAPRFVAGTVVPQAGQFSDFTLNLLRGDREQYVKGIRLQTPPGLLGALASVPLCGEAQADEGTCPQASRIGTTRVATGAGSHPFEIEGEVFLTGPYRGAPYGLSVVVHVVAGPFNLGVRVVRARISVDRQTSAIVVTTDETGPYAIPQIVFGVPVRLKRVLVDIDRPNFMFNPTSCSAQSIDAQVSGSQGALASVSTPFAVRGCKGLAFKPKFSVATGGHTSRAMGARLDAKLSFPAGSMGGEANVAKVKVSLPRQLPSRLTTLQKACPAARFESDPAACPSGSVVGVAKTTTPLLPYQLAGPVYFVSHGGEAFPSLVVVLEGHGIRVDLTGTTFIDKNNITSSTFNEVPDVPVSTFELYLPSGKSSALAANGDLCKAAAQHTVTVRRVVARKAGKRTVRRTVIAHKRVGGLRMPTEFIAQNGAVLKQSTTIAVGECASRSAARRGRSSRHAGSSTRRVHK